MTLPEGHEATSGLARCYRHPMRETGVRCTRCGRPICTECMRPASVGFHCPDDVKMGARSIRVPRTVAGAPARVIERAYVTFGLIAANVAVYIATVVGSHRGWDSPQSSALFAKWVLVPYRVADGSDGSGHEYYRLITSAFLHLSFTHILLNMVALGFIGPFVERVLGWWRYLSVYLLAAIGGSVAVYWSPEHLNATAGASGAIYGLFAASLVLARRLGLDLRMLAAVVAINFLFTFTMAGISVEGHVGGFVVGGLAALCVIGWPQRTQLLNARIQALALGGLTVLMVALIAVRTVEFPV